MKKLIPLFSIILVLYSCYNDNEEDLYGPVNCDITSVSFSIDVSPIISSSCSTTGCHSAGGTAPGDFSVFSELEAKVIDGSFENRVLIQRNMPPNSQLSNCELQILQAWLDGGAQNN